MTLSPMEITFTHAGQDYVFNLHINWKEFETRFDLVKILEAWLAVTDTITDVQFCKLLMALIDGVVAIPAELKDILITPFAR